MTRHEFLKSMFLVTGGAWLVKALGGCSDSTMMQQDASTSGNCAQNGTAITIAGNHGHTLMVSQQDVTAGVQKSYDIEGFGGHSHTVTLTAQHFTTLSQNMTINVSSTSGGVPSHDHTITVMCA